MSVPIIQDLENALRGIGNDKGVLTAQPLLSDAIGKMIKNPTFKVMVGVCTHRDVKLQIFQLIRQLEMCPNPKIVVSNGIGDALIDRSRGRMATKFLLETDADILFFLDDDIVSNTLDISKILWEMWQYNLDILGAPYPLKSDTDNCFAVRTLEDKAEFVVGKGGEIREVRYVSTGCMGIRRRVFEKMVEKEIVHLCHPDTQKFYPFFTPMEYKLNNKWLYLSEDWAFCQRAIDLGFKVWCDFGIKLGHIGSYEYTFDDFFRPKKEARDGFNYEVNIQKE